MLLAQNYSPSPAPTPTPLPALDPNVPMQATYPATPVAPSDPGIPNTGAGGTAPLNVAIIVLAVILAVGVIVFLARADAKTDQV